MSTKTLHIINNKIEKLNIDQHIEILRIIHNYSPNDITENKNGCFIDLSSLDSILIEKITKYLSYIETKEKDLYNTEMKKDMLKDNIKDESA